MLFVFYLIEGIKAQTQISIALGKARGNKTKVPAQNTVIKLISLGQLARAF